MGSAAAAALLAGCTASEQVSAPPRVDTAPPVATEPSQLEVPIAVRVVEIERALNARVPRVLWSIDERRDDCIPARTALGGRVRITPDISCRIVGAATRGRITVGGAGERLTLSMPVSVRVAARDVGDILKGETATAAARVRATARLGMTPAWRPTASVDIDYSWTRIPGIDFLGQRIRFAGRVDPRLNELIAGLERELPREIARINARAQAERVWKLGFASLQLNERNPPVWLRLTPQRIAFGGYSVTGGDIRLALSATALTETFVGPRPQPNPPTPLPPLAFGSPDGNARLNVPVIASYAELEPVLARALRKVAARGLTIPDFGKVAVAFDKVTIYATEGGRLAVGLAIRAESPRRVLKPRGTVWLTGVPVNAPGSQVVTVRDLRISGATDSPATNLLARIVLSPETVAALGAGLSENFTRDYNEVLGKANRAIGSRRLGDAVLSGRLADITNGRLAVYGAGLYMPVVGRGEASIRYAP